MAYTCSSRKTEKLDLTQNAINKILDFWFGELDQWGMPLNDHSTLWFGYQQTTDQLIEQQFGTLVASALAGDLNHWRQQENGNIALVLLLDQFTRNIFRNTPQAFSGDSLALDFSQALAPTTATGCYLPSTGSFLIFPMSTVNA